MEMNDSKACKYRLMVAQLARLQNESSLSLLVSSAHSISYSKMLWAPRRTESPPCIHTKIKERNETPYITS